jgi:hypothetical protein
MRSVIVGVFLAVAAAMVLAGCSPVREPWDTRGYFKNDRTLPADVNKALQERAEHGQTDREPGIQQLNRT